MIWYSLGNGEKGGGGAGIRIFQALGKAILRANKHGRSSVVEGQVGIRIGNVHQRVHVLIAQSNLDRGGVSKLKAVLREAIYIPLPKLHLRDAGLTLFHGGRTKTQRGARRTTLAA